MTIFTTGAPPESPVTWTSTGGVILWHPKSANEHELCQMLAVLNGVCRLIMETRA